MTRAEYDKKRAHGYAGPGRPMDPAAPGVWWMEYDPRHGTVLVFGELDD